MDTFVVLLALGGVLFIAYRLYKKPRSKDRSVSRDTE